MGAHGPARAQVWLALRPIGGRGGHAARVLTVGAASGPARWASCKGRRGVSRERRGWVLLAACAGNACFGLGGADVSLRVKRE